MTSTTARTVPATVVRLAAALTIAAALMAGCGSDPEPDRRPASSGTPSPPATEAPTAEPTGRVSQEMIDLDSISLQSSPQGLDAEQKAVLDAYVAYWQVRAALYNAAEVDADALGKVASLQAASTVADYVSEISAKGEHTEGKTALRVSEIVVNGDKAVVVDCLDDQSANVSDKTGEPTEEPAGDLGFQTEMTKVEGRWYATQARSKDGC